MTTPNPQDSRPSTADLASWDRQFLWHPFTPMKPWCENKEIVIIERGEGVHLIDTEGRRYLDAVSSLWCNVHGHNVPELNAAVTQQLNQIAHSTLLGLSNIPAITLAKRLIELTHSRGLHFSRVFYSDNGSTAVEVACKMAYQYWQNLATPPDTRTRFLAFHNAYHGDTLGAVSVGGIPLFHSAFKSLTFAVDFAPAPSPFDHGAASLAALDKLLTENPEQYAALIIEPLVLGAGGMAMYPASVLTALRQLADKHNTLLIFDEVLTGFGRTGAMFAAEHAPGGGGGGVTPDLMCLSKGLTAGYMPLGVTLATSKIFNAFYVDPNAHQGANISKTFFHGHTFTGHPLACAVALASLDLFEKNETLSHVRYLMPLLTHFLLKAAKLPGVARPRQLGLIAALDLVDPITRQPFPYHWRVGGELCIRLRTLGIFARPLADTLILMPPLAISADELQSLTAAFLTALTWLPEIVAQKS